MNARLERRVTQAANHLTAEDHVKDSYYMILYHVVHEAAAYFDYPGGAEDFCIQLVGEDRIVFGGWNRLIYTPGGGYRPDLSSCSPDFLAHYKTLGRLPRIRVTEKGD